MRTHLVLPESLIQEIDEVVAPRKRSKFVEDAVREKLRHEKLLAALDAGEGIISSEEHPEWATTEDVAKWVRDLRRQGDERVKRVERNDG